MNLLEILQNRHSVRSYTNEPIPKETLIMALQAGLLSLQPVHPPMGADRSRGA